MSTRSTVDREAVPWGDLDPGIRPVVAALVDEGFTTIASCQGHGEGDAWVTILPTPGDNIWRESGRVEDVIRAEGWWRNCICSVETEVAESETVKRLAWIKLRWWGAVPFR